MIAEIQKGVFEYLLKIYNQYGIDIEFRYDPELDLITEFRKSPRLRIQYADQLKDLASRFQFKTKSNQILGLFNRSPIVKESLYGNNQRLELYTCTRLADKEKVELRSTYFCNINLNIKLLFDSNETSDNAEMIYGYYLSNQHRSFRVTYDLGTDFEELTNIPYSLYFSEIEDIGAINNSNLRTMSFSVRAQGAVITPFTVDEPLLHSIETKIIYTNNLDNPRCEYEDENNPGLSMHDINIIKR